MCARRRVFLAAALTAGALVPAVVEARLVFDPADPAFTNPTVEGFDPNPAPGSTSFTLTLSGVQFAFDAPSGNAIVQCNAGFGADCSVYSFGADGVRIFINPPVAAVGFQYDIGECPGQVTFTGSAASESHRFLSGQRNLFVGAADVGDISAVHLSERCFAASWDDLRFAGQPGLPPECRIPADIGAPIDPNFKESDPPVSIAGYGYTAAGRRMTYVLHYENVGNADAHDVLVLDPLPPDLDETTLSVNDGGAYDTARRTVVWRDAVLPPATPRSVSFSAAVRADAPAGTRIRNVGTIVFPDADPPSRVDTNFVEHSVVSPDSPIVPDLRVLGCAEAGGGTWTVDLVNDGLGFAYSVTATIVDPPAAVQVGDATATFHHPHDPDPAQIATVLPLVTTTSADTVAFTSQTPGDACPALRWRIQWQDLTGQVLTKDVRSAPDGDGDAVADADDNCPGAYNPRQDDADGDGTGDACENRPPDCAGARASVPSIWPPNHRWVAVEPIGATDPDGEPVSLIVTGVHEDEPVNGSGDGDTAPDAALMGSEALVRAERRGGGNGRVYHLSFTATDPAGATCSGVVTACVPHDSEDQACGDEGPLVDSTAP